MSKLQDFFQVQKKGFGTDDQLSMLSPLFKLSHTVKMETERKKRTILRKALDDDFIGDFQGNDSYDFEAFLEVIVLLG